MSDLARALHDFVSVFEELGVPYVVMGGIAVRFYGIPRATYDVDFTAAIDQRRLPELYRRVRDLGYTIPEAYDDGWVDRIADMPLVKARIYLEGLGVDVDLFLAESRFQRRVLERRVREQIENVPVWTVTPEDLVLLKLLAGRSRDVADVGDVLFTQGTLDLKYLRRWAKELGVLPRLERVLAEQE